MWPWADCVSRRPSPFWQTIWAPTGATGTLGCGRRPASATSACVTELGRPSGKADSGILIVAGDKIPDARTSHGAARDCWARLASVCAATRRLRVSFVPAEGCVDPVALRDARLRMGLTQHELARLIDVAGGERISRWELGSSAPRPEMLLRLAQALNVDAADLLTAGAPSDLRRLRTSAGLSARTLADRAHMSVPTYIRWESGHTKRIPDRQALKPLAKALNVTVEDVESSIAISIATANIEQVD